MRCRRESAVAQYGNASEKAGTTTHKRAPIVLRRRENRHLAGQLISPKEGTREKPAAFARKQRANSQKRPTSARELRILSPDSAPDNETAKAPNVNGGRVLPNASGLRGRRGVRRATVPLRLRATRLWAAAGRRDPRRSALPHSKAGKGAQALRATGDYSRYGSAARGAIRICVPTLGDFQGAWSRETRRCHTGAHALSRRRTRRLS